MAPIAATSERLEDPSVLVALCHHRWGIPIVAALQRSAGGAKFVAIQSSLGCSRDALSRTIAALGNLDLVLRNPGYGHPMRPEYLLTPFGEDAGPACLEMWDAITSLQLEDPAGRKWSLPALWAIGQGAERFTEAQRMLTGVTPRALTIALRDLEEAGLIQREVTDERPPGVRYSLTHDGRTIAALTDDLANALAFGR